jgi:hypothetical protein
VHEYIHPSTEQNLSIHITGLGIAELNRITQSFRPCLGIVEWVELPSPQSRPWDCITRHGDIRVEQNTWVIALIKAGSNSSHRVSCARTRNVNVHAERIVLRAIERSATVACDNFVAEDVMACYC